MESGGNSSIGLKKNGKKIDRTRRSWTPVGELVLVDLIKELLTKQWRTKNGFKPGRLLKLESGMMRKISGTDIRDTPHIAFRIAIWKKFQRSLQTMMCGNSGIGFNSSTSVIDYHNDAWASIVKDDPNAVNMCFKSWPLYNDWCEIFGMECANGRAAEDVVQAVNGLDKEAATEVPLEGLPTDLDPDGGHV